MSDRAPQFDTDWVTVPRSALELIHKDVAFRLYVLVMSRARYPGSAVRDDLEIGQCQIGEVEVAELLGTSRDRVRGAIRLLMDRGKIHIRPTSRGTIVTVLGYGGVDAPATAESPAGSTSNPHPIPTNKNQISDLLVEGGAPMRPGGDLDRGDHVPTAQVEPVALAPGPPGHEPWAGGVGKEPADAHRAPPSPPPPPSREVDLDARPDYDAVYHLCVVGLGLSEARAHEHALRYSLPEAYRLSERGALH